MASSERHLDLRLRATEVAGFVSVNDLWCGAAQDLIFDQRDEIDRLCAALERIAERQPKTLGWIKKHGIVFDGPLGADPKNWENVAFAIYTDLCEVDLWARQALGEAR